MCLISSLIYQNQDWWDRLRNIMQHIPACQNKGLRLNLNLHLSPQARCENALPALAHIKRPLAFDAAASVSNDHRCCFRVKEQKHVRVRQPLTRNNLSHRVSPQKNHRVIRLLYGSRCVTGRQPRKMPQKALGSIVGLLCTGTCLVQVSPRLRSTCRRRLPRWGRGSEGGWRPPVDPFCLLHKGNWARFATVYCGWRQLLEVFIYISTVNLMEHLGCNSEKAVFTCLWQRYICFTVWM